jgi:two-component system KDP operon response regulator KdpE
MDGLRVLIIEDELTVSSFIETNLSSLGYSVRVVQNGKDGIQAVKDYRPEVIILDLGLPDVSGIEVLINIREWGNVPIIILTANDSDEEKVKALDLGADDYLTKPFSINELKARLKAITRRSIQASKETALQASNIELNVESHKVSYKQNELHLTQTEFDILKYLLIANGKVVTHRNLLKNIWGPNSVEHTQYLRVYVGQLRKKLISAGAPSNIIITETGIGYRLNC